MATSSLVVDLRASSLRLATASSDGTSTRIGGAVGIPLDEPVLWYHLNSSSIDGNVELISAFLKCGWNTSVVAEALKRAMTSLIIGLTLFAASQIQQEITEFVGVLPSDFNQEAISMVQLAGEAAGFTSTSSTMGRIGLIQYVYPLHTLYSDDHVGYVVVLDIDGSELLCSVLELEGGVWDPINYQRIAVTQPPSVQSINLWTEAVVVSVRAALAGSEILAGQVTDVIFIGEADALMVEVLTKVLRVKLFISNAKPHTSISPLEVVITGAIEVQVMRMTSTDDEDHVIYCFVPCVMTLGVEVMGGIVAPFEIPSTSSFLPIRKSIDVQIYHSPFTRGDVPYHLRIVEGDRPFARDNHLLAEIEIPELQTGWSSIHADIEVFGRYRVTIKVTVAETTSQAWTTTVKTTSIGLNMSWDDVLEYRQSIESLPTIQDEREHHQQIETQLCMEGLIRSAYELLGYPIPARLQRVQAVLPVYYELRRVRSPLCLPDFGPQRRKLERVLTEIEIGHAQGLPVQEAAHDRLLQALHDRVQCAKLSFIRCFSCRALDSHEVKNSTAIWQLAAASSTRHHNEYRRSMT